MKSRPQLPKWYKKALDERSFEKHVAPQITIKKMEEYKGRKLRKREREKIWSQPYKATHKTFGTSVNKTVDGVESAASRIRKRNGKAILINDIGFGYNKKDNYDVCFGKGTYEPFFIANALEQMGKNYEVRAFALNPREVERAKEQRVLRSWDYYFREFGACRTKELKNWVKIPKRILEKVKFNQLDLITETPAKQADITTLMGVPAANTGLYTDSIKDMTLLKNAIDSTRKKGYIICELNWENESEICRKFGLKKVDENTYQKIR